MSEGQTTALKGDCVTLKIFKKHRSLYNNIARLAIYIYVLIIESQRHLCLVQCPIIVKEEYASTPIPPK